jgi:hypothetical protein
MFTVLDKKDYLGVLRYIFLRFTAKNTQDERAFGKV